MGSGFEMVFLDPITILFGENAAVKGAIDVRDNGAASLAANNAIDDLITSIDSEPVWSVLDQAGTQNMVRSALGQAGGLTNFDAVKKRLLASDYIMNFTNGVTFDVMVKTSDNADRREPLGADAGRPALAQDERLVQREAGAGEHHRRQFRRPGADALQDRRSALPGADEV